MVHVSKDTWQKSYIGWLYNSQEEASALFVQSEKAYKYKISMHISFEYLGGITKHLQIIPLY